MTKDAQIKKLKAELLSLNNRHLEVVAKNAELVMKYDSVKGFEALAMEYKEKLEIVRCNYAELKANYEGALGITNIYTDQIKKIINSSPKLPENTKNEKTIRLCKKLLKRLENAHS